MFAPHPVSAPSPTMHPAGISTHQQRQPPQRSNMNDIYAQKALMSLALQRQRMLANVLRGTGGVAPAPQIGINRPQGIPTVR